MPLIERDACQRDVVTDAELVPWDAVPVRPRGGRSPASAPTVWRRREVVGGDAAGLQGGSAGRRGRSRSRGGRKRLAAGALTARGGGDKASAYADAAADAFATAQALRDANVLPSAGVDLDHVRAAILAAVDGPAAVRAAVPRAEVPRGAADPDAYLRDVALWAYRVVASTAVEATEALGGLPKPRVAMESLLGECDRVAALRSLALAAEVEEGNPLVSLPLEHLVSVCQVARIAAPATLEARLDAAYRRSVGLMHGRADAAGDDGEGVDEVKLAVQAALAASRGGESEEEAAAEPPAKRKVVDERGSAAAGSKRSSKAAAASAAVSEGAWSAQSVRIIGRAGGPKKRAFLVMTPAASGSALVHTTAAFRAAQIGLSHFKREGLAVTRTANVQFQADLAAVRPVVEAAARGMAGLSAVERANLVDVYMKSWAKMNERQDEPTLMVVAGFNGGALRFSLFRAGLRKVTKPNANKVKKVIVRETGYAAEKGDLLSILGRTWATKIESAAKVHKKQLQTRGDTSSVGSDSEDGGDGSGAEDGGEGSGAEGGGEGSGEDSDVVLAEGGSARPKAAAGGAGKRGAGERGAGKRGAGKRGRSRSRK